MGRKNGFDFTTVGVVAKNSTGYVETMLSNLIEGRATVPLRQFDDADRLIRTGTTNVVTPSDDTGWMSMPFTSPDDAKPAIVSFTSGTEGASKAVLLSRGNLHDAVARLTQSMDLTSEIREYIGVPVYHSFGYGRCRAVLNAGGKIYIPSGGFDVAEVQKMLVSGEINAISAVPSLFRLFLQNLSMFGDELTRVRWVEIGSQFMSTDEKVALRNALPQARIVQHYGLTEASRTTLLRIDSEPESVLSSVGKAEGDVNIRIGDGQRIEVRGPHVAKGVHDGNDFRSHRKNSWFKTSDVGRIENGYLYFEGRADDVINCAGLKLSPDLIETHVRKSVPGAMEFGILRWPDPLRGDGIMLALGPEATAHEARIVNAICSYAETVGLQARGAISVRQVPILPRTDTGKLQRAKLLRDLQSCHDRAPATSRQSSNARQLFEDILGRDAITGDKSFDDLGGDSLNHIQVSMLLERELGEKPGDWEFRPLAELADLVDNAVDYRAMVASRSQTLSAPKGAVNTNPKDLSFLQLVHEDFLTNDASIFHQGFLMLLIHRFGNLRMDVKWKIFRAPLTLLYLFLNKLTELFFGMKLGYTVKVGRRVKLEHFGGMILGAREIGNDVTIRQNTTFGIRSLNDVNAKPVIGNFVDIGAGAVIAGDVKIGDNCLIGANSVIYSNIPANSVAIGIPAKVIGKNPQQNPSPLVKRAK